MFSFAVAQEIPRGMWFSMKGPMFSPVRDAILLQVGVLLEGASQLQVVDEADEELFYQCSRRGCCHCGKSRQKKRLEELKELEKLVGGGVEGRYRGFQPIT